MSDVLISRSLLRDLEIHVEDVMPTGSTLFLGSFSHEMARPVVPLLVPLRTGIWCILARRGAVWKSLVTICNKGGYSRQCDYVQGGAATPKIGLKIRSS